MTLTCIHCYASQSIEAMIESEAGRAYARLLLSQPPALQRGLAAYVWMFKPAKRKLTYERCLKLANEVLALGADPRALAAALSDTIESLRQKREAGDVRPLTGHNYLRRVLENVPLLAGENLPALPQRRASNAAVYDNVLSGWAGDDELRLQIMYGLQGLLALPLTLKPEAASIDRTASLWERQLQRAGLVVSVEDMARLQRAFSGLVSSVKDKFPEPSALLGYLPARKEQPRLAPAVPETEVDPELAEKITAFREGL